MLFISDAAACLREDTFSLSLPSGCPKMLDTAQGSHQPGFPVSEEQVRCCGRAHETDPALKCFLPKVVQAFWLMCCPLRVSSSTEH